MDQIKLTVIMVDGGGVVTTKSVEVSTDELKNLGKDKPMWLDIMQKTDLDAKKTVLKLTEITVTVKEVT